MLKSNRLHFITSSSSSSSSPSWLFAFRRTIHLSSSLFQESFADIIKKQEDHHELPKELISGAPEELITKRLVRIYKESKPATQSGDWGSHNWKLDWDITGKGHRWENDLIGYQSSGDYMQGTIMKFDTRESAVKFAQGQGWSFYVQEPKERHFKKKDYSVNFYHIPGKLKRIITK